MFGSDSKKKLAASWPVANTNAYKEGPLLNQQAPAQGYTIGGTAKGSPNFLVGQRLTSEPSDRVAIVATEILNFKI